MIKPMSSLSKRLVLFLAAVLIALPALVPAWVKNAWSVSYANQLFSGNLPVNNSGPYPEDHFRAPIWIAYENIQSEEFDKANTLLAPFINAANPSGLRGSGVSRLQQNDFSGAVNAWILAGDLVSIQLAATQAEKNEAYEEALLGYKTLIDLGGAGEDIYFAIANLLTGQANYPEADLYFQLALQESDNRTYHLARAGAAFKAGNFALSIREYNLIIMRNPADARAHFEISKVYQANGQLKDAIIGVENALSSLNEPKLSYLMQAATLYEEIGDPETALGYYGQVLEIDPELQPALRAVDRILKP